MTFDLDILDFGPINLYIFAKGSEALPNENSGLIFV
jgi:hypothetical protein